MTAVLNRRAEETFHVLVARPVRRIDPTRPASIADSSLPAAAYNDALSRYLRSDRALIGM